MLTSKMLRALAPVPAVMESPREAMMSMSAGRSWCTVRWAGGWRSLVIIIFIIMVIIIVIIIDDVDVRRSKLFTVRWAGGWRSLVVKAIMAMMCL